MDIELINWPWLDAIIFVNPLLKYVVIFEFFKSGHQCLCGDEIVMT